MIKIRRVDGRGGGDVQAWVVRALPFGIGSGNNNIMESQQVGSLGDYTRALFLAVRDLLFGCAPMINSKEGHRQMNNDEHDIAIRYRG